jgi:hypothetical protein
LKFELTDFSVLFVTSELSPICSFRKRSLNKPLLVPHLLSSTDSATLSIS